MKPISLAILTATALTLAGCGGGGSGSASSGMNPFKWIGGSKQQPTTLAPEGGFPSQQKDGNRAPIAVVTGAHWQPLYEGRMLVVTGMAPTKGWWGAKLVTEVAMPEGRIRGDESGVLRLRLVGLPPLQNTYSASAPAQPATDTITVAMTLSHEALASIREVVITGGTNAVTLRR